MEELPAKGMKREPRNMVGSNTANKWVKPTSLRTSSLLAPEDMEPGSKRSLTTDVVKCRLKRWIQDTLPLAVNSSRNPDMVQGKENMNVTDMVTNTRDGKRVMLDKDRGMKAIVENNLMRRYPATATVEGTVG